MKADGKENLLKAKVQLLQSEKAPESITARAFATAADVSLAMINYYFKSKDELVFIDTLLASHFPEGAKQDEIL